MRCNVRSFTSGARKASFLCDKARSLSAIITDLHMPEMDGLNFVKEVRKISPEIPIMAMSGNMAQHEQDGLMALNVNVFLDKPFSEAQIAEGLRNLLTHN